MRVLILFAAILVALGGSAAAAATSFNGIWLFDKSPDYPGVTMMEISSDTGHLSGLVTTRWYGPIDMQNVRLTGKVLQFEIHNLNDLEDQRALARSGLSPFHHRAHFLRGLAAP
jgi:alpha-galactosidase